MLVSATLCCIVLPDSALWTGFLEWVTLKLNLEGWVGFQLTLVLSGQSFWHRRETALLLSERLRTLLYLALALALGVPVELEMEPQL